MNPGFHRTEINTAASATIRRAWDRVDARMRSEYGEHYIDALEKMVRNFTIDLALDPVHVVNVSGSCPGARVYNRQG